MKKAGLVALVMAVVALWPSPARADDSWWGWLAELSGPGYFQGPLETFPVACWRADRRVDCHAFGKPEGTNRMERFNKSLQVTVGFMSSNGRLRFKDVYATPDTRAVHVIPVSAAFLFRPHQSIDIGPGAGFLFFSGEDVHSHVRLVLHPVDASWKFLLTSGKSNGPWQRALGLDFQSLYITEGFTGADFGNATTAYVKRREFQGMVGISIDINELRAR
jgi:hypothetical protein